MNNKLNPYEAAAAKFAATLRYRHAPYEAADLPQHEQLRQQLYRIVDSIVDSAETIEIDRDLGHEMRDNYITGSRYLRRTGEHSLRIRWTTDQIDPYEHGDPANWPLPHGEVN